MRGFQPAGMRNRTIDILRYFDAESASGLSERNWIKISTIRVLVEVSPKKDSPNQVKQSLADGYVFTAISSEVNDLRTDDRIVYDGYLCAIIGIADDNRRYTKISVSVMQPESGISEGTIILAGSKILVI